MPAPEALRDARGRPHRGPVPAWRIVSLVPSWTELLFALGAGERLVGVTDYCVHPAEARARAVAVGGTKTPRLDRIRALEPDLVIANREENRKLDVERLERAGLPVFVTYARTVPEAAAEIAGLGRLVDRTHEAGALVDEIEAALREPPAEPPVRAVALVWKEPYMAVGGDCFAHDLLARCGARNPFAAAQRRYPHVTLAELEQAAPEVVLLPTEPYPFGAADREALLGLACPAARHARIHVVEGELLTWYGPRIPRALRELRALLVPGERAV